MNTSFNPPEIGFGTVMGMAIGGLMDDMARNRILKEQAAEAARIARIEAISACNKASRDELSRRVLELTAIVAARAVEVRHLKAEVDEVATELVAERARTKELEQEVAIAAQVIAEAEAMLEDA